MDKDPVSRVEWDRARLARRMGIPAESGYWIGPQFARVAQDHGALLVGRERFLVIPVLPR
jgi:hypothetical protein